MPQRLELDHDYNITEEELRQLNQIIYDRSTDVRSINALIKPRAKSLDIEAMAYLGELYGAHGYLAKSQHFLFLAKLFIKAHKELQAASNSENEYQQLLNEYEAILHQHYIKGLTFYYRNALQVHTLTEIEKKLGIAEITRLTGILGAFAHKSDQVLELEKSYLEAHQHTITLETLDNVNELILVRQQYYDVIDRCVDVLIDKSEREARRIKVKSILKTTLIELEHLENHLRMLGKV